MISEIAKELVNVLIANVPFVDKVAGLVMPIKKSVNKIEKVFPVEVRTHTTCDSSDFSDLVPDSTKKCIIYCEKLTEIEFIQYRPNYWINSADMRLVVWYNLNMITEGEYIDEGILANNILLNLPKRLSDTLFTYVRKVMISPIRIVTGNEIFSKYTYDEIRTQFMTFPYGAFAIDVNVQYVMNTCVSELIPVSKCGFPEYVAPQQFDYELDFNIQ